MNAYTFRIPQPEARRIEVDLQIEPRGAETLDVRLPVWTPGSYLVREHQRHVDGLRAQGDGRDLPVEKVDKQTWRVRPQGARTVRVSYRLHCFELTVRTNHVDGTHAFLNPSASAAFVVGRENEACSVRVQLPPEWRAWVALPFEDGAWKAQDYDELADSPFECGPLSSHSAHTFTAQGVEHELVVWGRGDFDALRVLPDLAKIVDGEAAVFGGLPYGERYLFILHLNDKGRGGLEHRRSCALVVPRFSFVQKSAYEDFLLLVAHEFFHLWNVKRIRPDALGPFDYTQENYTKLLWVAEGITDYYADVALRRAGLVTEEEFLTAAARSFQNLQNTPGRLVQSAEESSFDSWIKYYRQDENSINSQVSYYDKGAILGLLLDLQIRQRSHGSKSLDDVMRYLYTSFFKQNRNYTPADFQKTCELMAGSSLEEFFAKYVRGKDELDYNLALAAAGLRLETGATTTEGGKPVQKVFFGAELEQNEDRLMVGRVYAGSPAYEQGLNTGDQIVALNNMRVTADFFNARLAERKPGDLINLTIFRFDDLSTLLIKLGGRTEGTYKIVALPTQTELQKQIYRAWLGTRA